MANINKKFSGYTMAKKAEFAAADLNNGGLIPTSRQTSFLLGLQDDAVLLGDIDLIPMYARKEEIHKMNLTGGILRSTQGQNPEKGRVQAGDRTGPTTSKIALDSVLFRGEVPIDYSTLEDNIEKEGFMERLSFLIGKEVQLDLEKLLINGDTGGSTTSILDDVDGVLVRAVSSIYDASNQAISLKVLQEASKTVPTRFEQDEKNYKYYFNTRVIKDYGTYLSARQDGVGENAVASIHERNVAANYEGSMKGTSVLAKTTGIYTNPKNIVLGMHRDVTITSVNKPEESQIIITVSVRCDINVKEEEGLVKIINLQNV